jgi:hypothetical protein
MDGDVPSHWFHLPLSATRRRWVNTLESSVNDLLAYIRPSDPYCLHPEPDGPAQPDCADGIIPQDPAVAERTLTFST